MHEVQWLHSLEGFHVEVNRWQDSCMEGLFTVAQACKVLHHTIVLLI